MTDLFTEALSHHRAGRIDAAADLYRRILESDPNHADSWNLLGVIAHQKGDHQRAMELIQRAIALNPNWPSYYVNLATALRALGRHEEAIRSCRIALDANAALLEARVGLGISLQAIKEWLAAEAEFRWLADHMPTDSRGPQLLASLLREQGRMDDAVDAYREALRRNANDAAAHFGLGTVLLGQRSAAEAEPHLKLAVDRLPTSEAAWLNYGACLARLGRNREAVTAFDTALTLAPNNPVVAVNLGQAYLACGDLSAAENCFAKVLQFFPELPVALTGMADLLCRRDRPEEAIPLYERALSVEHSPASYKGLAAALWEVGDVDRAVAFLREAMVRFPKDVENYVQLATLLASGGDLSGAVAACRDALRIQPGNAHALVELAQIQRSQLPQADREQLTAAQFLPQSDSLRAAVHFALAQVADAHEQHRQAAEHLVRANALAQRAQEARMAHYDPAEFDRRIDRIIETFGPPFFKRMAGAGVDDERPVFVVGMPRSGTTLVEQILASHRDVYGAGERRFAMQSLAQLAQDRGVAEPLDCLPQISRDDVRRAASWQVERLRQLDGGRALRVVDKMPDNFLLLGWLAIMFPQARVIHCRRDLRDVALSCWMTNFARINWSNDLAHIAHRARAYLRLMKHWRAVLPTPMFELDYERLVVDQESNIRSLIQGLHLKWDPTCLDFHKTQRLVKTASVTQVRQPMYARSVGRWKNYREALSPFLEAIGAGK